MSQAFLASLPEMQDERKIPLAWGLAAGGHHGSCPTTKVSDNLENRGGPSEMALTWPGQFRRELLNELSRYFGPLPSEPIVIGSRIHWLTGFVTFCDWIGSNNDWFPLHPEFPLRDHSTPEAARLGAIAALDVIGWHRRSVFPNNIMTKGLSRMALT